MKIKLNSWELNRMMKTVTQCIDPRFSQYSNIEIRHDNNLLTVRGTNGVYQASMSTPMLGGDGEKFCVDGTMFAKVCAMCSGDIEITAEGKTCTIKGAGRTRIPIVDADIPEQGTVEDGTVTVISAADFAKGYNGIAYAISADQSRIALTGAYCQFGEYGVKMVSLDGFQMSVETAECSGGIMNLIIPGPFMKLIDQAAVQDEQITIRANKSKIEAFTDSMSLTCGLLSGDYPDYQRIVPKEFKTECLLKADAMRSALKCGSIIASKNNLVKLVVEKDRITVKSNSEEADYEAEIPCETQGDGLTIAFNQKYLLNTINAIDNDEIVLKFNTSVTPCIAKGKDGHGIRLVLPVRVAG